MTIIVQDIWEDVRKILGTCSEKHGFSKLTDTIEVLSNSGDFDPLIGFVDICVSGRVVTLPREVDVPIAVNIGGRPTIGRDMLFRHHYNGTGDCRVPCDWSWDDQGVVPVYRDLATPSKLIATVNDEDDQNSELWAYGYNDSGVWVRSKKADGTWVDGYQVPTVFGYSLPDAEAPFFSRIVRIRKAETNAPIRLSSFDVSATTGTLIGVFDWDEKEPSYRRIKLNMDCDWIRVAFRRRVYKITNMQAVLPINSLAGIKMMLWAMKYYDEADLAKGAAYEATARRWITEAQWAHGTNLNMPIQVNDNAESRLDRCEDVN